MNILEKLYLLVRTLNMNDDNEEMFYGITKDFIRNPTDSFFMIIGDKASTNFSLNNMYYLKKV